MSKKKKDKFKKQIKAQILDQMAQVETQTVAPAASSISPAPTTPSAMPIAVKQPIASDSMVQNLPQIKYDLKKTAIVVACLALIIVALVLLDQKYGLLLKFGDLLFRVFHIQ